MSRAGTLARVMNRLFWVRREEQRNRRQPHEGTISSDEPDFWNENGLDPKIAAIASGSFRKKDPPEIRGTGYVVDSLEAALWAFDRSNSFRGGALLAVNLGDDADTTGAIYGQIAGAFYGAEQIPPEWRAKLTMRELITEFANKLHDLAN